MKQILILAIIAFSTLPMQTHGANLHIKRCEASFIGVEYNPKLEKSCRILWNKWSKQIINNHP